MTRSGKRPAQTSSCGNVEFASTQKLPPMLEVLTPITFKGSGGYIVTGPESHHLYCFSAHDPELMIDSRDVEALMATGLFCISY